MKRPKIPKHILWGVIVPLGVVLVIALGPFYSCPSDADLSVATSGCDYCGAKMSSPHNNLNIWRRWEAGNLMLDKELELGPLFPDPP